MQKTLFSVAALILGAACVANADAASAATTYRHHGATMMRHKVYSSAVSNPGGHSRKVVYGVGNAGQTPRITATGGNAGGYTSRN